MQYRYNTQRRWQIETFAKLNLKQKSIHYRVGIPTHYQTVSLITILFIIKIVYSFLSG